MSREFEQRAITAALSARVESGDPQGLVWSLAQNDWTGTCRKCGEVLRGSIKEIKAHVCKGE